MTSPPLTPKVREAIEKEARELTQTMPLECEYAMPYSQAKYGEKCIHCGDGLSCKGNEDYCPSRTEKEITEFATRIACLAQQQERQRIEGVIAQCPPLDNLNPGWRTAALAAIRKDQPE